GNSPKKATTGAENVGIWTVHASTSAVIVPSPSNTDRFQRPGVGTSSAHSDSIIRGVGRSSRNDAGTALTSETWAQRGAAAADVARGTPRIVTTAVVPIRNGCSGSRSSKRTRTWKRLAKRTQFNVRGTLGSPPTVSPSSGRLAQPMPCTTPRNGRPGYVTRWTSASIPGLIDATYVSVKFARTYQARLRTSATPCWTCRADSLTAILRLG